MIGKRRVRTRSKLLAVFLSAVMLVSLIPIGTVIFQKAGAIGPGALYENYGVIDDDDGHKPSSIAAGQVWTDKLVEAVGEGQPEQFDITLKAIAGNNPVESTTKYDIIFLLDVSQSMDGYLNSLRTAANTAISTALSGAAGNRVAVITFGRSASVYKFSGNETWISSKESITLSLDRNQGTHIQGALFEAYKLIKGRSATDAIPVIVLMSDGAPNCYVNPGSGVNLFTGYMGN